MHKKRLLKLADLIEREAREKNAVQKFDMWTWGYKNEKLDKKGEVYGCKTAACALGTAALSGEFKRAGLRYEWSESLSSDTDRKVRYSLCIFLKNGNEWSFNGKAHEAAQAVFGVTEEESHWLFVPRPSHHSPKQVAKNIRRFVEHGGIPS